MKQDDDIAAMEYVLGLLRGEQRRGVESRLSSDAYLRSCVQRWQEHFGSIPVAGVETLPPGLFQGVLARIDAEGSQLPGSITTRAAEAGWLPLSEGVTYRVLRDDEGAGRKSMLIRMQPGAIYQSHYHDSDEECLVIEGDLRFGDLELRTGDFHVALGGSVHPIARSVSGCLLHITACSH
jgi:quercetin dioxygenase-like cupin family protein